MSNNVPWAGPRLLVPISVDALVITNTNNATEFSIQSLTLRDQYETFQNLSPKLFEDTGKPEQAGVYLNWALPDGMTNGLVDDYGRVQYPYLPNRWMIVRFSADASIPRQAWVVESDWLGDTPTEGGAAQPQFMGNNSGVADIKFIGKWYDIDTWVETGQTSELFLTAVGNSDPLFAAYAGNSTFVYTFIDKLSEANPHTMSYMVSGWFSNNQYDILAKNGLLCGKGWTTEEDWLDLMNQLQWSVGFDEVADNNVDLDKAIQAGARWLKQQGITPATGLEGTFCAQTLCHGLVFGVQWPGVNVAPPISVPVYNPQNPQSVPYVSAANAATDCLASFMQWQLNYNNPSHGGTISDDDSDVEIMLEAFSHKMLPKAGGVIDMPDLMDSIRETWFGRMPGGSIWVAQAPRKAGGLKPDDTSQTPAQLTPELANALAALNKLQSDYDAEYRTMLTLQKQLYADWLKLNIFNNSFIQPTDVTQQQLEAAQAASLKAVTPLVTKLPNDKAVIDAASKALTTALAAAGGMELLENPANDFHTPSDPVFLVNNTKRSFKRGEDIIYSTYDNFLFVRFSGQFINSIQVDPGTGPVTVNASDICPAFTITPDMPGEIPALLGEAYLLDLNFAKNIALKATVNPPAAFINTIQQQQTLIWNSDLDSALDKRTLEAISGFNPNDTLFHVPSKVGVWKWTQPWTPLYMEWQIGFFPSVDQQLSQWEFDGTDYNWTGGTIPPPSATPIVYTGRSILTPKEAVTLQARLQDFINNYPGDLPPDYVPLQDVLSGVGNWDVLSQTLTGFSLQLLQWDIEQFGYQPTDPVFADAIGNEAHGMPMPIGNSERPFAPVRAGFVNIQKLWIVDDFGQVYNLMPSSGGGSLPPPLHPIPGIGVRPGDYDIELLLPTYFQLPPRVIQGSRLNFNFLSATNDAVISSQSQQTSPVCGWVLPNHLDNGVMVYDSAGTLLGEIMRMGATGAYHAQWVAAPFDGSAAAGISNKHLKGFVTGILGSSTDQGNAWSGIALQNFMKVIDETLWSVDPMGERNNQSLSILVGRPIAVVRAAVDLELYGNPNYDLSWGNTGLNNTGGIEQYQFDLQIGNIELEQDGVMGYFLNDNYAQFNSVHGGLVENPANPAYVINTATPIQFEAATPTYITLLLDPRGSIHCSTGILPVLDVELPELYIGKVLDSMLLEFKTGPLLVDQKQWWLPLPAGVGQQWSWLQPQQTDKQLAWTEIPGLVSANALPQLSDNPHTMVEGRLKLTGALGDQLMLFFFEVNLPGQSPYNITAGQTVQLSWSSQGAAKATLTPSIATDIDIPANSAAYKYVVTKTQSLVLSVQDANKNEQQISITINVIDRNTSILNNPENQTLYTPHEKSRS